MSANNTLYIIGGAGRAGKSTLARLFNAETGISYTSFDFVTSCMKKCFGRQEAYELMKTNNVTPEQACLYFCENIAHSCLPYCVEDWRLRPSSLASFAKKHQIAVKAIFLGFAHLSAEEKRQQLLATKNHPNASWFFERLTEEEQLKHLQHCIDISKLCEAEAAKHGYTYIDASEGVAEKLPEALRALIG